MHALFNTVFHDMLQCAVEGVCLDAILRQADLFGHRWRRVSTDQTYSLPLVSSLKESERRRSTQFARVARDLTAISDEATWTDADHAGCDRTRKRTSDDVIMSGNSIWEVLFPRTFWILPFCFSRGGSIGIGTMAKDFGGQDKMDLISGLTM